MGKSISHILSEIITTAPLFMAGRLVHYRCCFTNFSATVTPKFNTFGLPHITYSYLHSPSGVRFLRPIPPAQKNSSKILYKKNRKNAKMSLLDGSGMAWRAGGYPSIFFHHFFLSLPIVFTINLPLRPDCSKMNIRPIPHSFFPLKRLSIHYYMVYAKCSTLGLVKY